LDAEVSIDLSEALMSTGELDRAIAEQERRMELVGQQPLLRGTALLTALAAGDRKLIEDRLALAVEADVIARAINEAMGRYFG
jgi:hypothetical protein